MLGDGTTATTDDPQSRQVSATRDFAVPALVVLWSHEEPERVGEVGFPLLRKRTLLGRGEGQRGEARLGFTQHRPGAAPEPRPLLGKRISRTQLSIQVKAQSLEIQKLGKCPTLLNGREIEAATLVAGDTLLLGKDVLLGCVVRSPRPPAPRLFEASFAASFGHADQLGLVGESAAIWRLRDTLAFAARSKQHVLVTGPSGVGKELAARALHTLSGRTGRLVTRNAATVPAGIIDAELFGNMRDYPNPKMPERPGLVGAADGGTLFLDEIGELTTELQAHLLRVLDNGEYQRLGETTTRKVDLRLVGATNREASSLKHDLLARLTIEVAVPGLEQRREDVPLLLRAMMRRAANESPDVVQRFLIETPTGAHPNIDPALVDRLVRHNYTLHAREVESLMWKAITHSEGDELRLDALALPPVVPDRASSAPEPPGPTPTREQIETALEAARGSHRVAAAALGLTSRFVLYRLMKKYRLEPE